MKYTHVVITSIFALSITYTAQAETKQKVHIEQATVFLKGAELVSSAKVNIPAGESEVIFTNISGNVNEQSLNVVSDKDVVVQSSTYQNTATPGDVVSPLLKSLRDSIEKIQEEMKLTAMRMTVVDAQLTIFDENNKLGGENKGLSIPDLQHLLELVNKRMEELLVEKHKLELKNALNNAAIAKLNEQINQEQQKNYQAGGQLTVKFYATEPATSNIVISYVIQNAGWNPSYDLRVEQLGDPVKLFYKANVYQNSGIKWDKAHIILSTGNPNENAEAPVLNPWYLSFYVPPVRQGQMNDATVNAYRTPLVDRLETRSTSDLASPSPGVYQRNSGSSRHISGDRSNSNQYNVDGVTVQTKSTTINQYVIADNSGINSTFDIDLPYSIPSDGQQHAVAVKTYELPATYRYYAVPKMDKDAFLQAQVTNWENLNLLPAKTSIFYEGSYVGQGELKMQVVTDTMTLSLGRDKKIMIKREKDKELKSKKTMNTNALETVAYTTNIRNTRKQAIDLVVMDQMPVSNDNNILIEDQQREGAEYNEDKGEVKWTLHLASNESKMLKLGYTVKYPKQKTVNNL